MCRRFEVGLFAISEQGTCLVGRSEDLKLVRLLREQIAADCRRELARVEPPVRLASEDQTSAEPDPGDGGQP